MVVRSTPQTRTKAMRAADTAPAKRDRPRRAAAPARPAAASGPVRGRRPTRGRTARSNHRRRSWVALAIVALMLAFGLVFMTVLAVGYFAHWLIPELPLPIAFALAAVPPPSSW